jgi:hypothetical protein
MKTLFSRLDTRVHLHVLYFVPVFSLHSVQRLLVTDEATSTHSRKLSLLSVFPHHLQTPYITPG